MAANPVKHDLALHQTPPRPPAPNLPEPSPEPSLEPCRTLSGTFSETKWTLPGTFCGQECYTTELCQIPSQILRPARQTEKSAKSGPPPIDIADLLRNLLRKPSEPYRALHLSLLDLLRNLPRTKRLCHWAVPNTSTHTTTDPTKREKLQKRTPPIDKQQSLSDPLRNLHRKPSEPCLALHLSLLDLLRNLLRKRVRKNNPTDREKLKKADLRPSETFCGTFSPETGNFTDKLVWSSRHVEERSRSWRDQR